MKRRAFTLIEVIVALVVTGLVVSMAYAALQAGFDTSDRLTSARDGAEREIVARSILSSALRHALPGTIGGEPVFVLRERGQGAAPGDELVFRTRGVLEPFGATGVWEVTLLSTTAGMRLSARAVHGSGSPFSATLHAARAIDVRVRGRDPRDGWLESWLAADRSPVAVSIAFLGADGRARGAPLIARVGLEGNP
ncbi:MAG TPA: type II secretion system protein [Gemmatimonadaceae bacterium]